MQYLGLRVRDLELLEACRSRRERDRDPAIRRTVLVCEGGRDRDRDVAADGSRLAADGGGNLRRWTDGDEDDEFRDRLKKANTVCYSYILKSTTFWTKVSDQHWSPYGPGSWSTSA